MNAPAKRTRRTERPYILDDQVGFMLRQVGQRHTAIFTAGIGADLTTTQWAALAKLAEIGPVSQNLLGRHVAMDAATIKGVIDRLTRRGLTETSPDPEDGRRLVVALSEAGRTLVRALEGNATRITDGTLAPLSVTERDLFLALLAKLR
jgi:DNA-binding MarR family transcriptional regulator